MDHTINKFENKLSKFRPTEKAKILKAVEWAQLKHGDQKRASGEPFFIHPLKVAEFLVDLGMDHETVIAALLHDVLEDTGTSESEMKKEFGRNVVGLVDGVTKISIVKAKSKSIQETETMRKMLIAMTKDIRVIIIKLADKLHNMQTLQYLPAEKRKRIANECLEIYAPLAGRLGISGLKTDLEDLAIKHLKPEVYKQLSSTIHLVQHENLNYLKKVERTILRASMEQDVQIEVSTRAKHIYSVYRKMKKRKKSVEEINDLLGIRILCNTPNECYTILGIVHRLWPPIENRFKDYIAMPKANQYQSLHTTVMCFDGRRLEVQIRTYAMHYTAEYGVAAHWIYKDNKNNDKMKQEDLAIINKLKRWNEQHVPQVEFWEDIKSELLRDSIYVFTPKGHIVELAKDATPIDFAYHIHTEVGNRCIGAKADGSIITLSTPLRNTQVVEVMTSNRGKPNVNWLRFAKTSKAKNKIRQWLNKHNEDLIIEKNIIAKSKPAAPEPVVSSKEIAKTETSDGSDAGEIIKRVIDSAKVRFKIGDENNMMISIANCCHPQTGDDIIGYVSRGRGIIVHKRNCPNLRNIKEFEERSVEVEWEAVSPTATRRFEVTSKLTNDLFSEIEGSIRKYGGHLIEGKLEENDKGNLKGAFTMEMNRNGDYRQILKSIRTIPSVLNIRPLS
ncbi:MAG: bifunctional (p)ppGpp synthetase/guanosine-3',5'-bis(diphosphate) 3'-pyrophosphohydrolase [Spirochaetales bacterium]|uniref:Bifunctional (P)ppGpp synthetase/guanosine-3',5'-bis(Diphosphate) 3'-pyrophosphohydrolase n=1 Tax=Candidatus Thalassospirochaeta sargassi TaxID=3119039 RepID=A0AAJ1IDJ8_9SPIO|nr:bifunctional (p)ppGpp synthetase/guanosine-3',5'-bis(diphosphate) 3'-pyrophosphohydrolase [Spirochaetales bacterium]